MVEHVVAMQRVAAEAAGLQLSSEVPAHPVFVRARPENLLRAITNLISNAVKYTRTGTVDVLTYTEADRLCVQIKDTGLGIAPNDLLHLFERFYRGKQAAQSSIPGTGLGLSIVKEIVESHGGTVEVASELGVGSTFRLWLPVVIT
jgi:two-component system sensor histidine kinase BaeS